MRKRQIEIMVLNSLAGQTLFYLCVVTGAHIVYSRHGGSKEKIEGEEGKESGEKIYTLPAHWNVNGMFVVEETHDKLLTCM